jgi:hypothetical protein
MAAKNSIKTDRADLFNETDVRIPIGLNCDLPDGEIPERLRRDLGFA